MAASSNNRGQWGSKLGFVLAAAGSAVGLGNIWGFPTQVADNGGFAFLSIYILCCFLVGYPVMVAELAIGRKTQKNPVGAFLALNDNKVFGLIGAWGVLCGVMILSFYTVIAGWTFSFVFAELLRTVASEDVYTWFADTNLGLKSAIFSLMFMVMTIWIVSGGISSGIERATKTLMPTLISIMVIMIIYVLTRPGAAEGLSLYLTPDFSQISTELVFDALGQAFFSLSLGMGALITYGSYLDRKQNIPEAAAYVTMADFGIAFMAGLLIMPAMFVAQNNGIDIFDENGALLASTSLVFNVLPSLFHSMGSGVGLIFGVAFFVLLSMAALTSTISLLEVPVSYMIDEKGVDRKRAAWVIGGFVGLLAVIISFQQALIGTLLTIFNNIGLPLGGLMICLFLAYVWKTGNALLEMEDGYEGVSSSLFGKIWPIFVRFICPLLILAVFVFTVFRPLFG